MSWRYFRPKSLVVQEERCRNILLSFRFTEKTSVFSGSYAFNVLSDAKKFEIASAVELIYGVEVSAVKILASRLKLSSFRGRRAKRSVSKKAYVFLKDGFSIDISNRDF